MGFFPTKGRYMGEGGQQQKLMKMICTIIIINNNIPVTMFNEPKTSIKMCNNTDFFTGETFYIEISTYNHCCAIIPAVKR